MEINTVKHGFRLEKITELEEIQAQMYEMVHEKSKAKLIWLKREDENKTFSIAFKTTPDDDTGVFHILEHSVLNGSKKYPVREPFVDLLKGSLQTFLNAMTYPDKTVYPVSSRNDKDFINLMRVYLDAVFNPLVLENPNIFYQEGWHYELNSTDEDPIYKGVVFNEMKGAFSSADGIKSRLMMHNLFPDTCYGNESGGDPEYITSLTYEGFCAAHRRYYHPSNSYIFLDGDMDIDQVLGIIDDEYLSHYDSDFEPVVIRKQESLIADDLIKEYEISPNEDPKGKSQLAYGYVIGDFNDYEKIAAFSLIASVLSSNNEAPLKKAILEKGLGEDISFDVQDGILQPFIEIDVTNTDLDKEAEIRKTIREVFEKAAAEGLDREELSAALNQKEFRAKERDFGGSPKGLVFALSALDSWLYGGSAASAICYNELFRSLREKLDTSFYEDLIRDYILNSKHSANIFLKPSNTLGQEKLEKEKAKLLKIAEGWSDQDKKDLVSLNEKLLKWQSEEDTPEQKATLPSLKLSDLKTTPTAYQYHEELYGNNKVVVHDDKTNDITYAALLIEADDCTAEELRDLAQLLSFLGNLKTENYDVLTLNRQLKSIIGDFAASLSTIRTFKEKEVKNYVVVTWSALTRNDKEAAELIKEIIYKTDFSDKKAIHDLLKQNVFGLEQAYINAGHALAVQRALSYTYASSAIAEHTKGYEAYKYLKDLDDNFDEKADQFLENLKKLSAKLFVKERYTLSVTADSSRYLTEEMLKDAPHGTIDEKQIIRPLGQLNEGIIVPSNVSFAAKGSLIDYDEVGTMLVLSNILSFDYLWNLIRVKGGAYGCGFRTGIARTGTFYSYRDPEPRNSLKVYADTPAYLKEFADHNTSIENYIVGTTGDFDPYTSLRMRISSCDVEYLMGYTYEDKAKILKEILDVDIEDIRRAISVFDKINEDDNICVIGNKEALERCEGLKTVFDLKQ